MKAVLTVILCGMIFSVLPETNANAKMTNKKNGIFFWKKFMINIPEMYLSILIMIRLMNLSF